MPLSRALYTTHFLPTAPHLLPMTHLSIQWGWVGGGGKSQETSEVQKRVGQQQQQQQSRISGEKLLSTAPEQSSLYIVSFSFCVHPPTTAIAIKGYFTRFHFQTVSWRGIMHPATLFLSLFRLCCIHTHALTILVLFPILYWKRKRLGARLKIDRLALAIAYIVEKEHLNTASEL